MDCLLRVPRNFSWYRMRQCGVIDVLLVVPEWHWLPVYFQVKLKMLVLAFKAFHGMTI